MHSPFVYDLVTNCFYDKKKYNEYKLLKQYRKDLLKNNTTIQVTDFGAGSRVFTSNKRTISAIAKNVGIPKKRARFLFRLVNYLSCKNNLELGTSLGIGAAALAANKKSNLLSIEGCPQTAEVARKQLKKFNIKNVKLTVGEFEEILSKIVTQPEEKSKTSKDSQGHQQQTKNNKHQTTFDLIYFDGHHTKKATLKYFQQLLSSAHNSSVFVFDDIHWSAEMEEAWEEIKAHPKVRVTIDTFFLGLVFFRKEQAKQHFTIRL
ncbi:Predicted O-methyltransferase YrrM [Salegentibacter agarivorans]|uniref:Predicted O-methyltransferase YrrM n=1 Tax=Salegentibacter agarivorans TaxID=345907 RepID=A0A1I2L7I4_9FLAO|nr:class I SAM-dependent methyltransferase [Salegentibacter agarivorans]SFF74508.1 Predicted O-methyltransferase YrrM [Salegentibacter agarivorans]